MKAGGVVFRRFGKLLLASLTVLLGLGLLLFFGSRVVSIKTIEVVGEGITVVIDEQKMTKNLLFFPSEAMRVQLLRDYPILESVSIKKQFPSTLVITAVRRPALVRIESTDLRYLVAGGGTVIAYATGTEQLPVGYIPVRPYGIGETIEEPQAVAFVSFVEHLADTSFVQSARGHDGASLRLIAGTTNIFIPQEGDFEAKASTLQTLIAGFRIKGTLPTVIDLRFDKPIVTF